MLLFDPSLCEFGETQETGIHMETRDAQQAQYSQGNI